MPLIGHLYYDSGYLNDFLDEDGPDVKGLNNDGCYNGYMSVKGKVN